MTVRPTPLSAPASRTERLDRLPFTARHRSMLVGSGVGWALDAMDVGLISFLMVAVKKEWGLTTGDLPQLPHVRVMSFSLMALRRMQGLARQASLDPGDGIEL